MPVIAADAVVPERAPRAPRNLLPEAGPPTVEWLGEEDAYWHSHHDARPLPVLRVRFTDPAATWFHVDPGTGETLDRLDQSGRAQRRLFDGLHTLDLGPLIRHRPARDVVVWLLCAAGLAVSVSGAVISWRRLRPARRAPALPR